MKHLDECYAFDYAMAALCGVLLGWLGCEPALYAAYAIGNALGLR